MGGIVEGRFRNKVIGKYFTNNFIAKNTKSLPNHQLCPINIVAGYNFYQVCAAGKVGNSNLYCFGSSGCFQCFYFFAVHVAYCNGYLIGGIGQINGKRTCGGVGVDGDIGFAGKEWYTICNNIN